MKHIIKIEQRYHERILAGQKKFEVRKNDRDYQVGDELEYRCADEKTPLRGSNYLIEYIHHGLGMQQDYCVLGIIPKGVDEKRGDG